MPRRRIPKGSSSRRWGIAALWANPAGTNNGSAETFHSTVYHARTRIRAATGEAKTIDITNRGTRYLLDPAEITTGLARFTKGRYVGGRVPYGYLLVDAGPHPNKADARWGRRLQSSPSIPRPATP